MRPSLFNRQGWLLLVALLLALGAFSACGSESTVNIPVDGDNDISDKDSEAEPELDVIPADGDPEAEAEKEPEVEVEVEAEIEKEIEAEVETEPQGALGYRADTLTLFSPEMSMVVVGQTVDAKAQLNQQIAQQIENGQLNMLVIPQTSTPINFPNTIRLTYGTEVGSSYRPSTDYSYDFVVKNEESSVYRFKSDVISFIEIPISQANDQIFTLRDAVLSGTYEQDLSAIASGLLAGAISEADADNFIVTNYGGRDFTLKQVFTLLKLLPNYNFKDGSKGYSFIFKYSAQKATIVE